MALSRSSAIMITYAAITGVTAVALSAWAAHGLESVAPTGQQGVAWFVQATDFQMNHTLAIILIAILSERMLEGTARKMVQISALLMGLGIILFSGSLYSASFNGTAFFAPFGGFSSMVGWVVLGLGALVGWRRGEIDTGQRAASQAAE